jgi:hypothetical protein
MRHLQCVECILLQLAKKVKHNVAVFFLRCIFNQVINISLLFTAEVSVLSYASYFLFSK